MNVTSPALDTVLRSASAVHAAVVSNEQTLSNVSSPNSPFAADTSVITLIQQSREDYAVLAAKLESHTSVLAAQLESHTSETSELRNDIRDLIACIKVRESSSRKTSRRSHKHSSSRSRSSSISSHHSVVPVVQAPVVQSSTVHSTVPRVNVAPSQNYVHTPPVHNFAPRAGSTPVPSLHTPVPSVPTPSVTVPPVAVHPPTPPVNQFLSNSTSQHHTLGNNEFSTIVADAKRIRYDAMASTLKESKLLSDSQQHLKEFYTTIAKSVVFALGKDIVLFPSFQHLHRNINFHSLFFHGVHGPSYKTSDVVFQRLGATIHQHLITNITEDKAPRAALHIVTHNTLEGWPLLQLLLCKRAVVCGACPDVDLDQLRTNLQLFDNESYSNFYIRAMDLRNEYSLTHHPSQIPMTKLVATFLKELSRAPVYVPYLTHSKVLMMKHLQQHGDTDPSIASPFSLEDIYNILEGMNAPSVPVASSLTPYVAVNPLLLQRAPPTVPPPTDPRSHHPSSLPSSLTQLINVQRPTGHQAVMSALELSVAEDCANPTICLQKTPPTRCQACLLGNHKELECFARGPMFQPPPMRRRIAVYNTTHGSSPPADHVYKEYRPHGVHADHSNPHQQQQKPLIQRPFQNYKTKTTDPATIKTFALQDKSFVELHLPDKPPPAPPIEHDTVFPDMRALITDMQSFVADMDHVEDDDDILQPTMCGASVLPSGDDYEGHVHYELSQTQFYKKNYGVMPVMLHCGTS